jgi:hypothetical protein
LPNGRTVVEQPEAGCVQINPKFSRITRKAFRAALEDVLQQDVQ